MPKRFLTVFKGFYCFWWCHSVVSTIARLHFSEFEFRFSRDRNLASGTIVSKPSTNERFIYHNHNNDHLLREKCPDTEFSLVRIFLYSD